MLYNSMEIKNDIFKLLLLVTIQLTAGMIMYNEYYNKPIVENDMKKSTQLINNSLDSLYQVTKSLTRFTTANDSIINEINNIQNKLNGIKLELKDIRKTYDNKLSIINNNIDSQRTKIETEQQIFFELRESLLKLE